MRLNLRQQAALAAVIDKAQRTPGTHTERMRDGMRFTAQQNGHGSITWTITDASGAVVKEGR